MKGEPVEVKTSPLQKNFRDFRKKLEDDGYFKRSLSYSITKFITCYLLAISGCVLAIYGHWIIGAILLGLGYQQFGWLAHDMAHHNFTSNRKWNNFLIYMTGNVGLGISCNWWKNRHNTHHAITNVLEKDPDTDNLPLFVWDESDLEKVEPGSFAAYIVSYQHYYFVPWTISLKLIWNLQSISFVLDPTLHNKPFLKSLNYEKFTLLLHWTLVLIVALLTPTWTAMLGFLFISESIGGAAIALIVFMNHYALDLHQPSNGKEISYFEMQVGGTRNINPGPIMNWLSGGLNLQIEHHLFPTMPRNNLLKIRPLVQKFSEDNGFKYETMTWFECLYEVECKLKKIADSYVARTKKLA